MAKKKDLVQVDFYMPGIGVIQSGETWFYLVDILDKPSWDLIDSSWSRLLSILTNFYFTKVTEPTGQSFTAAFIG